MVQGRGGGGLPFEPRQPLAIRGKLRRQNLHRDMTLETCVERQEDLSHPPRAQRRDDLVGTQTGARTDPTRVRRLVGSAHRERPDSPTALFVEGSPRKTRSLKLTAPMRMSSPSDSGEGDSSLFSCPRARAPSWRSPARSPQIEFALLTGKPRRYPANL